jgi:hypothetical protein
LWGLRGSLRWRSDWYKLGWTIQRGGANWYKLGWTIQRGGTNWYKPLNVPALWNRAVFNRKGLSPLLFFVVILVVFV